MRGRWAALPGLMAVLLAPLGAWAADIAVRPADVQTAQPPALRSPDTSSDWTVTVGAEGRVEPIFQGSSRDVLRPYPIVAVRRSWKPEPFRGPRDGIGIGLIEGSNFQIGPVGQLIWHRRERMDPSALQGLGDVRWAVELGVFGEYWAVPWLRTRAEVRQGFNGHHGVVADIFVDAVVPVGPQLTLSGGPRLTLASTPAVSPYFSIDAVQSAASGLPIFDAKGGVRSVGAGTQARYLWTPQFATHVFFEYERLNGDVASSPLVTQRGNPNQFTFGFGATRSFDIKLPW
jgi:MipA family protein